MKGHFISTNNRRGNLNNNQCKTCFAKGDYFLLIETWLSGLELSVTIKVLSLDKMGTLCSQERGNYNDIDYIYALNY